VIVPPVRHLFRFGPFEFDAESGELRKQGIRIQLQPKAQQLLAILLENPGSVITREELRQRLWDDGTFVDFESGLNTTANRLRIKLGDSASNPRYVETLPRVGYRFIGSIDRGELRDSGAATELERASATVPRPRWRASFAACAAVTGLLLAALAWRYVPLPVAPREAHFRELTFRRGQVTGARFMPDGQTVLYTAQWVDGPRQLYIVGGGGPESRPLGLRDHSLASVSRKAELAVLSFGGTMNISGGVLSRVPVTGSAPAFADRGVMSADWTRDGERLVLVRATDGKNQLESPSGTVVYRTGGWLSSVRVAPDSDRVAFVEHPFRHDESGRITLFEPGSGVRVLSDGWASVVGLAWHPAGREVWFTAAREDRPRSVWAVTLDAKVRPVAQAPGVLTLRDIASDGRVLVTRDTRRLEMAGRLKEDAVERDFSWLDWSRVQELSSDGRILLFDESGEAVGNRSVVYLRDNQTGDVRRLGAGMAMGLAPGGELALIARGDRERLALVPLKGDVHRWLPSSGLRYQWARFLPNGEQLLALASRPQHGLRLYTHNPDGSSVVAISPEMTIRNAAISPKGDLVAVLSPNNELVLYDTSGRREPRILPTAEPLAPLRWTADGISIVVQHLRRASDNSAQLSRVDVSTGHLTPWKKLQPPDPLGVNSITGVALAEDCESYVYSYRRALSELFVVDGWR
jgi:DNA-binding winged helix-turn-helix (wHTH) protein/WD40 repeat protein